MKRATLFTALLLSFTFTCLAENPRDIKDFNFDWKFQLGDYPEAKEVAFDDADWRPLNLPHDWSIEQNYTTENTSGSTGFLPTGIGWYRKTFNVDAALSNKRLHVEFDGIFSNSEVWINGHYLGKRPYGYSLFNYELTPFIKFGSKNTISVKVDNANFANSRWYTGSGIYRNVRLVSTSNIFIPQHGAWIQTPLVSSSKAKIELRAVVANKNQEMQKLKVTALIKDGDRVVAKTSGKLSSHIQDTAVLSITLKNPKLWSLTKTHMYQAEIHIYAEKELMDTYELDFGIREIRFDANKGFFLNGENIKLKGVCLHHDGGATGAVFIRDVWKRRLAKLQDIGTNAIRISHNPGDPGLLKLCDEMGFVVINEALDEWHRNKQKWVTSRFQKDVLPEMETGYGDIYEEWAERDVKDMVRYSRNHPSIIMWSMGNEIEWTYPHYWKMEKSTQGLGNQVLVEETGDGTDELKETAEEIYKWIHEVDDTRFITTGGVLPKAGNITGYFDVPDVMGYNYRAVNYDSDHEAYPNRIMYGSENWGTYQEWKDAVDRDFVAGIFLWTGIAYLGESGPFPWKGLEISLMDFCGFTTPRGHFYKTLWNKTPSIHLSTKHQKKAQWIYKNGEWVDNRIPNWLDKWLFEDVDESWNYNDGDSVFVEVYSNSPELELFVNNQSYGIQRPDDFKDHIVKYLVPYSNGEIKAIGLRDGKQEAEHKIRTAKWIGEIVLKADRTVMKANGYDAVHIEAFTKTKSGDLVPDQELLLRFNIEGEGLNVGIDNGWDRNIQNHRSNQVVTHNGKAMLLVQSTRNGGEIKISARAGKLKSNVIMIKTE